MFGLTFEKLLVVGLIAAVVIGPHRLPGVVARLASLVRGLRRTVDAARERAAIELGVPTDATEWRALDPRRYDPRRIISEALAAPPVAASVPTDAGGGESAPVRPESVAKTEQDTADPSSGPVTAAPSVPTRRIRVGTSAHPRWIEVPLEPSPDADTADPAADRAPGSAEDRAAESVAATGAEDATTRIPVTA
ncbi:hypothetical protein [Microbacterium testaceum]|uniref:hypothetical protein n=1 Tax=Microbacterium testaceum TaxID=2033 RepID=UPI0007348810|nr:hypothetical protein [Microbacterium testaceum]